MTPMTEVKARHWVDHWCQVSPDYSHLGSVAHGLRPLLAELDRLRADVQAARECAGTAGVAGVGAAYAAGRLAGERDSLARRVEDLERLAAALSERVAAASEVLSRAAERGTIVRCRECSACRGRGRFELSPVCHWCDGTGLALPAAAGVAVLDDPEADLSRLADDGGPHAGEG